MWVHLLGVNDLSSMISQRIILVFNKDVLEHDGALPPSIEVSPIPVMMLHNNHNGTATVIVNHLRYLTGVAIDGKSHPQMLGSGYWVLPH